MLTDIWFTPGYTLANVWFSPGLGWRGPSRTPLPKNKLRDLCPWPLLRVATKGRNHFIKFCLLRFRHMYSSNPLIRMRFLANNSVHILCISEVSPGNREHKNALTVCTCSFPSPTCVERVSKIRCNSHFTGYIGKSGPNLLAVNSNFQCYSWSPSVPMLQSYAKYYHLSICHYPGYI